jgi:hypothetical protein
MLLAVCTILPMVDVEAMAVVAAEVVVVAFVAISLELN